VFATLDESGKVSTLLADSQVHFDGIAAPILYVTPFQINVQVPYELAGRQTTTLQCLYKNVASNKITLGVVEAAPEIYRNLGTSTAAAMNEDGLVNSFQNAASAGSVVTFYVTGAGQMAPPGVTGRMAEAPYGRPLLPVSLLVGARDAEILYAGEAPGMVGVMQVNARLPQPVEPLSGNTPRAISMFLRLGDQSMRQGLVTVWMK